MHLRHLQEMPHKPGCLIVTGGLILGVTMPIKDVSSSFLAALVHTGCACYVHF